MTQLVGYPCPICSKTITIELTAVACEECGRPVHRDCLDADWSTDKVKACKVCGSDTSAPLRQKHPDGTEYAEPRTRIRGAAKLCRLAGNCFILFFVLAILFVITDFALDPGDTVEGILNRMTVGIVGILGGLLGIALLAVSKQRRRKA